MREFFSAVGEIQGRLKQGREGVTEMERRLEEMLQATAQERQRAISEGLNELVERTNGQMAEAKRGLEALKAKAEAEERLKPSAAQGRIRMNMQRALAKKQQELLMDFQQAQVDFKRALEWRQLKELQLLCPEASGEQLRDMMEEGQTSAQVMARRMAGAHAAILDEVERIRDKHQDILRLEKSIQDLAQMVQEIAMLVDSQGELLDNIESHVHDTKAYTGKGAKELDLTLKIQHSTRKWQLCLSCFCVIVALAIMWPILMR